MIRDEYIVRPLYLIIYIHIIKGLIYISIRYKSFLVAKSIVYQRFRINYRQLMYVTLYRIECGKKILHKTMARYHVNDLPTSLSMKSINKLKRYYAYIHILIRIRIEIVRN